ncbi:MAG: DEAD/DEAH box helicase [Chloroflexota bacterium]
MGQAPYLATGTACVVCTEDDRCDVAMVEGDLVAARAGEHQGTHGPYWTGTLVIRPLGARRTTRVHVGPQWGKVLHALAQLWPEETEAGRQPRATERPLLRFYHLDEDPATGRLSTGPASLVVVEPDHLVDVSLLENTSYCMRQWMAAQLKAESISEALVRGTVVHACLQHRLQHHLAPGAAAAAGDAASGLAAALDGQTLALALLGRSRAAMTDLVMPHLERLDLWYQAQGQARLHSPYSPEERSVRSETLLLCPELGLRGRIDAVALRHPSLGDAGVTGRPLVETILELKTGKANPSYPDPQFQVQGYQSILHVQNRAAPGGQAWVVYTGALAYDIQRVDFDAAALHRVVETRDMVVLAQRWDHVPATGTERQCARAGSRDACQATGFLLGLGPCQGARDADMPPALREDDRRFYARYHALLRREAVEGGRHLAALWRQTPDQRIRAGSAVAVEAARAVREKRRGTLGWRWVYTLPCRNESELRPGDRMLLSDGDPVRGEVVSGTIDEVSRERLVVSTADALASPPALVDRYAATDALDTRAVRTLASWLASTAPAQRARLYAALAVAEGRIPPDGGLGPRFSHRAASPLAGAETSTSVALNGGQRQAVERALAMQDYLLIQGPPGTGKTTVIARIVAALVARGERVILSAWTNRAVDTMLHAVLAQGIGAVRLGSPGAVDAALRHLCILPAGDAGEAVPDPAEVARALATAPVLAATASTWADSRYRPETIGCDVVIMDEAAQATVPAALGPLRLARRFILVGDDRQLPAVVACEAIKDELGCSLFELLRPMAHHHGALIALTEQYRMNAAICAFPSAAFYEGRLQPHPSAAARRLGGADPMSIPLAPHVRRALDHERGLVLIDVRCPLDHKNAERENPREAAAIAQLAGALCDLGLDPEAIGVVAPFRAQVALIRRHLEERGIPASALTVDTVDRFQGSEREAMLLSLVGSPAQSRAGVLEFLADPHRLNVALTRARGKLLVLGDVAMMSWQPVLSDLVAHCYARDAIVRWPR